MNLTELPENVTNIIVGIVVFAVVAVPIFYMLTTEPHLITNDDTVGPLRLGYQEQIFEEEVIESEVEGEEDTIILVDVTDYISKHYLFSVSEDAVSVSGDWSGSLSLADNQIIIGSDNYQLTIQYGNLIESVGGYGVVRTSLDVAIQDGNINGTDYTFIYYPDANGQYANYYSYQNEIADVYSAGTFAGVTVSAINNESKGDNPFGFDATVQIEDSMTTGVIYAPGEDEPETPEEAQVVY